MKRQTETAIFGWGCFWGPNARLSELEGVIETTVGYAQGARRNPSYMGMYLEKALCALSGREAAVREAVQVRFDAEKISYEELLDAFFSRGHPRPESGSKDAPFVGFHDERQESTARDYLGSAGDRVTRLEKLESFYPAELAHQHFEDALKAELGYVLGTFLYAVNVIAAPFLLTSEGIVKEAQNALRWGKEILGDHHRDENDRNP